VRGVRDDAARAGPRGRAGRWRWRRPGRLPGGRRPGGRARVNDRPRVLVKEKIGDSRLELLREAGFDVEVGVDWPDDELGRRIGEFGGVLIRSATELTADRNEGADRLRGLGRAG